MGSEAAVRAAARGSAAAATAREVPVRVVVTDLAVVARVREVPARAAARGSGAVARVEVARGAENLCRRRRQTRSMSQRRDR